MNALHISHLHSRLRNSTLIFLTGVFAQRRSPFRLTAFERRRPTGRQTAAFMQYALHHHTKLQKPKWMPDAKFSPTSAQICSVRD